MMLSDLACDHFELSEVPRRPTNVSKADSNVGVHFVTRKAQASNMLAPPSP